jgi:hypothetical protein
MSAGTYPRILVIRTGGTYDAEAYDDPWHPTRTVTTRKGKHSFVEDMLNIMKTEAQVDLLLWGHTENGVLVHPDEKEHRFVKDSKQFSEQDMKELADLVRDDKHYDAYIFLHGSDKLVRNSKWFEKQLGPTDKKIFFNASIVPLSMHVQDFHKKGSGEDVNVKSDGIAALQYTLDHFAGQPAGVHLVARDKKTGKLDFFSPSEAKKSWKASFGDDLTFTLQRSR